MPDSVLDSSIPGNEFDPQALETIRRQQRASLLATLDAAPEPSRDFLDGKIGYNLPETFWQDAAADQAREGEAPRWEVRDGRLVDNAQTQAETINIDDLPEEQNVLYALERRDMGARLAKIAADETAAKMRAEREYQPEPVEVDPEALARADIPKWMKDKGRVDQTLTMMDSEAEKLDLYAYVNQNVASALDLVKKSGLPSAEEVDRFNRETGIPRSVVADILPHAKDELEARALAKRLVDIYGGDWQAMQQSYVIRMLSNPEEAWKTAHNAAAYAKLEAAMLGRYGNFAEQQLFRGKNALKTYQAGFEASAYSLGTMVGSMTGWDSLARETEYNRKLSQFRWHTDSLDTGNPKTDWLLDKALIDAPNLYSQVAPYAIFGPRLGGVMRYAGMFGSSLSGLLDEDVPMTAAVPLAVIDSSIQRYIEQKYIYPRFASISGALDKLPALERPMGSYLRGAVLDSIKQMPDEFFQESSGKLARDVGYLFTDDATWKGFKERVNTGWSGPLEGAATAGVASAMLIPFGFARAARAHHRHSAKLSMLDSVMDAARENSDRVDNPERFVEVSGKITENAERYNQDAPAEVYLSSDHFDALTRDMPAEEKADLLARMNAGEEYSRSRATGAEMCIKTPDYAKAIAGHAKEGEFRKWIKVDPDGMTVQDAEKAAETEKRILAEAEAAMNQLAEMDDAGELPPELAALRQDLRDVKELAAEEADQIATLYYQAAKTAVAEEGGTVGDWLNRLNLRAKFADQVRTQEQVDDLKLRAYDAFEQPAAAEGVAPTPTELVVPDATVSAPAEAATSEQPPVSDSGAEPTVRQADAKAASPEADAAYEMEWHYVPSRKERETADRRAADLEQMRMELGALLAHGKSLSGGELARYGLRAWHPQSVRMRMAELRGEAEAWRKFQDNPDLVARLQEELGDVDLPSKRFAEEEKAAANPIEYLSAFPDAIGRIKLVPGLVAPAANKIKSALRAVYSAAAKGRKNALTGIVSRVVDSGEAAAYKTAITRDIFREGDFTEAEINAIMAEDYTDYFHVVDNYGIGHTLKGHTDSVREASRGHEAITSDAIQLIPEIASPKNLVAIEKNYSGLPVFIYEVERDGATKVIEEIRKKRGHLTFQSMDGRWSGLTTHDVPMTKSPGDPTSETTVQRQTARNNTIPSKRTDVKPADNPESLPLVEGTAREWVAAAVDTIAAEAGVQADDAKVVADAVERIVKTGEDLPEAQALAEELGLVEPTDATTSEPPAGEANDSNQTETYRQSAVADDAKTLADITFYDGVTLIRLFRGRANFSSILHEMGHVLLRELQRRVENGTASELSRQGLETLRKLAGGEFTTKGVEKVMRHWEAYLREGVAPARTLTSAFDTFRTWLTGIYENIRDYLQGEDIDDATRTAFDHLLASDKEIREVRDFYYAARERLESLPIYSPELKKKIAAKRAAVERDELSRQDRIRIRAYLRAMESREPVRDMAAADIDAMRVYAVLHDLAATDGGINEAEAVDMLGEALVARIKENHGANIFDGDPAAMHAVAGDHGYADAREMLDELAKAKDREAAIKDRIKTIINERTAKASEWIRQGEAMPGDAAYHNGNRLELLALQLEGLRQILSETQGKRIKALNLKAVTDAAATAVGRMRERDIGRHHQYANAERREGGKALRLAKAGDYQAAYEALERQMFNHAVTAEMFKAREERERFKRNNTLKSAINAIAAMQEDYREPYRQLLARYGVVLRPRVVEGAGGERFVEWVTPKPLRPKAEANQLLVPEAMRDPGEFGDEPNHLQGFTPDLRNHIAPWILRLERPANFENWRDLTVRELGELRDAMRILEDHGKGQLKALWSARYKNIEEAVTGIVEEILKSPKRSAVRDSGGSLEKVQNLVEREFLDKGLTLDTILAVAEGNRTFGDKGELQTHVETLRECEAERDNRKKAIADSLAPHLRILGKEARRLDNAIKRNGGEIDGLPFHQSLRDARGRNQFTGEMIIAAILNTGTADNLYQLQNAYEWDDAHISVLRSQLSRDGWEAIQAIWDAMDSLFADNDKVAFEAIHQHPAKEPALAFSTETADGQTYDAKGGYYPLAYDGLITPRQGAYQDLSSAQAMAAANSTAASEKPFNGFNIERARGDDGKLVFKGAPLLALSPLPRHFDQVTHFITHALPLWELNRITGDPRFRAAFVSRNGMDNYRAVRRALNYAANPRQAGDAATRNQLMDFLHQRYITSVLGLNFYSAIKQRLGFYAALSPMSEAVTGGADGTLLALKYTARAMWDFGIKGNLGIMSKEFEAIKDISKVMKSRDESGATKEMRDAIKAIAPGNDAVSIAGMEIPLPSLRDNMFVLLQIMDRAIAGPLWKASYNMAMDGHIFKRDGMDADTVARKSIRFADSIAMTQASPFNIDHSALQRGEDTIAKFASICISGVMQPGNLLYQKMAGMARGNVTPAQCAAFIAKTYIAASYTQMLASALWGLATGDDDPWPEWYEWFLAPVDNMLGWIPYVRNVTSISKYGSSGKGVLSLDAANKQIERIGQAAGKAREGKYKDAAWQGVQSFCYAAGIPLPAGAKIYKDIDRAFNGPAKKKGKRKAGKIGDWRSHSRQGG